MTDILNQGWLVKSQPAKGWLINSQRWRRRWFVLRAGTFPHQFILEYFADETCRRRKGCINLDECEEIAAPLTIQDRHKFTFNIRTQTRTYFFAAETDSEMNKWVHCLCHVCGLKTAEEDNGIEMYGRPIDENNRPTSESEQHLNNESDESSPTLSTNVSGPYIPISECITGKPIIFDERPNMQESTYCNTTSFPFPPRVNWSTYPANKRDTLIDFTRNRNLKNNINITPVMGNTKFNNPAPPRPPKKISSKSTSTFSETFSEVITPSTISLNSPSVETPHSSRPSLSSSMASSVFRYDKKALEEAPESSPSSSINSPRSPDEASAGALYSNISDFSETKSLSGPIYMNPPTSSGGSSLENNLKSTTVNSSTNFSSSSPSSTNEAATPPPKVDRHLKPDARKTSDNQQQQTMTQKFSSLSYKHSSGAMTLPSRNYNRQLPCNNNNIKNGPAIDRTRKPPENSHQINPITLCPTPAQQLRSQSTGDQLSLNRFHYASRSSNIATHKKCPSTSTLPSNQRSRRAGPLISPIDKKPTVFHEYEQTQDLIGTYLQIDSRFSEIGEQKMIHHNTPKTSSSSSSSQLQQQKKLEEGSVEYRLIDPVKTKALNQMIQEREEQLRTHNEPVRTLSKSLH